jgi:hypothetical protein
MPVTTPSVRVSEHRSGADPYRYSFFRSIEAAGHDWDLAAPAEDLFLHRRYLAVVEANPPLGMRFGYLVFYRGDRPIGVALCQIKYFKGDDNINDLQTPVASSDSCKDPCFFTGLAASLKRWVAGRVAADILICGNMLLTGEHGYWFDYTQIGSAQAVTLLEDAMAAVINTFVREGVKMPVVLVKDVAPANRDQGAALIEKGFVEFDIQPNMVLDLPYRDFDHYLGTMSTKYRTRAKRAFKKADGIVKKELQLAEIQRELPRLYELYREIARNAGFNMVDLNEHYLLALKRELPQQFRLFAYYRDGELLAFYTTIRNGDELEAHFLGYDKAHNHDLQLYLNILYDIVRNALDAGCHRVVFARTALEIKSSVGAVAHELYCYLRHQHPVANRFTSTLLDYLKPVEVWQPRHPFKEEV